MIIGRKATVSELANVLITIGYQVDEEHEDVRRWSAPRECHEDVNRGYDTRCVGVFAFSGWFPADFMQEITNRLGGKWLYFNYTGHLIEDGCKRAQYEVIEYGHGLDQSIALKDRITGELVI